MYKKENNYTALGLCSLLVAVAAFIALWNTNGAQAAPESDRAFVVDWGIMSLARGQTARLNVAGIGNPDTSSVRVTLYFDIYEAEGGSCDGATAACTNNLRFLRRESRVADLRGGAGVSFNFWASENGTFVNAVMVGDAEDTRVRKLAPTLEIREAARTLFVAPAVIKGFNPQPDPPGE
ncbi:MAG TPA: hypothetical protein VNA17_03580 [Pyrinomonadaceae bacterium]|nr:hypothetical protein [Pyrinomonadaceae bacterium]